MEKQLGENRGEIVLDFQEVTFVDADGVQSWVVSEAEEKTIVPCPPGPNISIAPIAPKENSPVVAR